MYPKYSRSPSQAILRTRMHDPSPTTRYNIEGEQLRRERAILIQERLRQQSRHDYVNSHPSHLPNLASHMQRLISESESQSPKVRRAVDNLWKYQRQASTCSEQQAPQKIIEILKMIDIILKETQIQSEQAKRTLYSLRVLHTEALNSFDNDRGQIHSQTRFRQAPSRKHLFAGVDKLEQLENKLFNEILSLREDKLNLMKELNEQIAKGNELAREYKKLERECIRLRESASQRQDNESEQDRDTIIGELKGEDSRHQNIQNTISNLDLNRVRTLLTESDKAQHPQPPTLRNNSIGNSEQQFMRQQEHSEIHLLREELTKLRGYIENENSVKLKFIEELEARRKKEDSVYQENQRLKTKVVHLENQLSSLRFQFSEQKRASQPSILQQQSLKPSLEETTRYAEYKELFDGLRGIMN